jgi:type IV pilus assembly protein PilX
MPMYSCHGTPCTQRGTALVVSLVLLLVMTLIGISAMNSSVMQGLMSTSYQSQATTLSGAEVVLREAELDVEALVLGQKVVNYYDLTLDGGDDPFPVEGVTWPSGAELLTVLVDEAGKDEISGQFVIEYLGQYEVPGETAVLPGGAAGSHVHVFRVTARGDGDRGALRTVQSVYVTLEAP